MITQEELKHLFDYEDGFLIWKNHPNKPKRNGMKAGSVNGRGYYYVGLSGKSYRVHRLIWLYHKGYLSEDKSIIIDHIDRDRLNNRIENLREATISQNNSNRYHPSNTSGQKGVRFVRSRNKYKVSFNHNKEYHYYGLYTTFEEACEVFKKKYLEVKGEFATM
jgi:hypothetical protein